MKSLYMRFSILDDARGPGRGSPAARRRRRAAEVPRGGVVGRGRISFDLKRKCTNYTSSQRNSSTAAGTSPTNKRAFRYPPPGRRTTHL
eukprot:scaffold33920_cov78-Phaeocystis_antarctica.AAC.1